MSSQRQAIDTFRFISSSKFHDIHMKLQIKAWQLYLFTYSHSFLYEILNSETDIPTHYYCQQNFLSHYNNSVEEEYKDFTEDSLLCRIL